MKECTIFPRDPETLEIIKEMERYLAILHKDINKISDIELIKYINQLAMTLH
jgi:hypothetical protein